MLLLPEHRHGAEQIGAVTVGKERVVVGDGHSAFTHKPEGGLGGGVSRLKGQKREDLILEQ